MNPKTIDENEVVSVYVSFFAGAGRKRRPVLIMRKQLDQVLYFRLTSKYGTKSPKIQRQYYPIQDWRQIGLKKATYVDIGQLLAVDLRDLDGVWPIGKLSLSDRIGLNQFILNFKKVIERIKYP